MPGLTSNFFQGATVLYTAAHLDVAPFQRVWNPDTNNDYTAKEFAEGPGTPDHFRPDQPKHFTLFRLHPL